MSLSRQELQDLLRLVGATEERELDCDEFLALVAGYLERLSAGERPSGYAGLRQHLQVCPECQEELAALLQGLGLEPPP